MEVLFACSNSEYFIIARVGFLRSSEAHMFFASRCRKSSTYLTKDSHGRKFISTGIVVNVFVVSGATRTLN